MKHRTCSDCQSKFCLTPANQDFTYQTSNLCNTSYSP